MEQPNEEAIALDSRDLLAMATEKWAAQLNKTAHTSFRALQVLIKLHDVSVEDYLRNPAVISSFLRSFINDIFDEPWNSMWRLGGTQDSGFALAVSHALQTQYPNLLKFRFLTSGAIELQYARGPA